MKNGSMKDKLHVFQRTMLLWNRIHPYNAVHVIRMLQPLDLPRLESIIQKQLEMYHLTGLALDKKQKRFSYQGGAAAINVKIIEEPNDVSAALDNEIAIQLNTSFPMENVITPFRFFVVREGSFFYLGLVYLHFVSSAESIIYLLQSIFNKYMNKNTEDISISLQHYPLTLKHMLMFRPKYLIGWLLTLPSYIADVRRSFRPSYPDINNHHISFSHFSIEPSRFRALVKASKRWGVTLNDVFLALLLLSISPFASKRLTSPRRKKISVASVVNIREELPLGIQRPFGLYLGSFMVSHNVPQGISLAHLVKDIHEQTVKIKRQKLYLRSFVEQMFALTLIPLFSQKRQGFFYTKYYPLWGGISNVNLNTLWDQSIKENQFDYIRAVSTGPVAPLVFSLTTVNETVKVGVSFRDTVFSRTDCENIIKEVSNYIGTIEKTS